jgi:hypothetical protein
MDYRRVLGLSLRRKSGKENSGKQSSSKQEKGIQVCTLRETRKTRDHGTRHVEVKRAVSFDPTRKAITEAQYALLVWYQA